MEGNIRQAEEASPSPHQQYIHDYSAKLVGYLERRTGSNSAGFFLPYLRPGMSLLDCGCGPGSITIDLARHVVPGEVVGIDIAESQIERAEILAKEEGASNVRFQVASVYELPFPGSTFAAVFSNRTLEHLSDPLRALREMRRVMKPGGIMGVRDSDWGGNIYAPYHPVVDFLLDFFERVWKLNGGESRLGRQLPALLSGAGLTRIIAGASYEMWANADSPQAFAEMVASLYQTPAFAGSVAERGWMSRERLSELAGTFREWAKDPKAFFAHAACEVVGWKE